MTILDAPWADENGDEVERGEPDPSVPGGTDWIEDPTASEFADDGLDPMPTAEQIEESRTEPSEKPIYGGDGENMEAPRRLVAFVELPDRRNLEFQARNLLLESDIREAMAKGARRLYDAFMQRDYGNIGFVFDPEKIEYDFTRLQIGMDVGADTQIKHTEGLARVIVCTVVIRRG